MRRGGDVGNGGDFEADGLQGADGRLTTSAGTLHAHGNFLEPVAHRLAGGILRHDLRDVGGRLLRAAETALAGGRPADDGACHVGDRDDGVVKRRGDVGDARENVLAALGLDDLGLLDVVRVEREAGRKIFRGLFLRGGSAPLFLLFAGSLLLGSGFLFRRGLFR